MRILGYLRDKRGDATIVFQQPDNPWLQRAHPSKVPGLHHWERRSAASEREEAAAKGQDINIPEYWGRTEIEAKDYAQTYYGYVGSIVKVWHNE